MVFVDLDQFVRFGHLDGLAIGRRVCGRVVRDDLFERLRGQARDAGQDDFVVAAAGQYQLIVKRVVPSTPDPGNKGIQLIDPDRLWVDKMLNASVTDQ